MNEAISFTLQDTGTFMVKMVVFFIIYFTAMIPPALIAGGMAKSKGAFTEAFCLGLLIGPLAWFVAPFLDNRPKCPQCLGRLNGKAALCMHCKTELSWGANA